MIPSRLAVALALLFITAPAAAQAQEPASPCAQQEAAPTAEALGFPIYPSARFLTTYDAGRGQCYVLFGADLPFRDMVNYYRRLLDERGDRVFDEPATHVFEVGRFRESTMAFPPGVTIKDYTWNESPGYLHAGPDGPVRYGTIIQIVPAPAAQRR